MGTKFANLHIQTARVEETLIAIKSSRTSNSYYAGASDGWVSVFGDGWNWEVIELAAQKVSALLSYPVLYIGYFDDDVLELGLFHKGRLITKHISGVAVEEYDLELTTMNIELFQSVLQTTLDEEELAEILAEDDLSELMERLERLLQLPLWMKFDWIADDEELTKRFIQV